MVGDYSSKSYPRSQALVFTVWAWVDSSINVEYNFILFVICLKSTSLSSLSAGIFLNYMATKAIMENRQCNITLFKVGISIFFYVSYAILFGNFFYWTYIHKREPKKEKTTDKFTPKVNGVSKTTQNGHVTCATNGIPNAKTTVASGKDLSPNTRYNLRSRKNWFYTIALFYLWNNYVCIVSYC